LSALSIQALLLGIIIATVSLLIVYPFFPEDPPKTTQVKDDVKGKVQSNWIAIRSTLIVFPVYLILLSNPLAYMPVALKSVLLSQQASTMDAKHAGIELVGSTFLGGVFAVLFWFALGLWTNLWMFFLWMLLFCLYFSCKIYRLLETRFPASFWINTAVTMLIMLGPAVEDSANGKDVYAAFFSRLMILTLVTFYALFAVYILEAFFMNRKQSQYKDSSTHAH